MNIDNSENIVTLLFFVMSVFNIRMPQFKIFQAQDFPKFETTVVWIGNQPYREKLVDI